ncbi:MULTISPECIES: hypothetical protein [unclassified Roseofilum]|uniref:hypothetical protein n=1 Tax=unclassified Roseofilum TaxID=2620099 RepID=UPI000E80108B|nr:MULTISPECIES: hypothetical protein [unclassified Roseofilum]MBP0009144.1 hypothetical protein [Roseofilum sp. Belize Diploria]MBP0033036.1 hypothetical protein [Roseofilum sp. Belize BBD 4]MBP0041210.1 hypothetical protein [Roseofilum sp. SBFL]HBQ98498.1 hypothetical protein [Cyanobacteria bacterium UBA11691]
MNHEFNNADLAMAAMNHPKGYEILTLVHSIVQKNTLMSFTADPHPQLKTIQVGTRGCASSPKKELNYIDLPRSPELQYEGVNIESSELLAVVAQYPQRLTTAIDAWLKWAYRTDVEYPTFSLIKAIKEDWCL